MTTMITPLNGFIPSVKEWYWVPHPSKVWITVLVKRVSGNVCWVTTSDSMTEFELSLTDCPFLSLNPRVVGDMASLLHLHEAGILHNLSERASPQQQHPYTYVSTVLIAVNPLRPVPMPVMEDYKDIPMGAAPPNPYGIAEMAYKNLTVVRNKKIRWISIMCKGKTETAKIVLRYLCWRATAGLSISVAPEDGRGRRSTMSRRGGRERGHTTRESGVSLDRKLLDTNPILEAFGNAKTFRNANSSRFGKLLKLNFNTDFRLVSASIDTYLLEKSRVALFPEGERNYHVFYQVLQGAGSLERKRWFLKDISQYTYLNGGHSKDIDDVDDKADFSRLTSGLLSVGINMIQQDLIFRVLSAILYLGNVTFEAMEGASGETAEIEDPKVIARIAELLGVQKRQVEAILKTRSLDMAAEGGRTTSYRIPLDVKQAVYARDAVAKSIYDTIFHWIISQIRHSLQSDEKTPPSNYIGVLDIFGFESFEQNGLEQLLINYANESLQLIFNRAVLDAEQDMYLEEGFMVEPIEYVNNNDCVNLIAMGRDAILTSLDAVCKAPEPTEEKFNTLLHKTHTKNSHFLKPAMKHMRNTFKIKHYAKAVHYTVGTFIPKNMDSCPAELVGLLSSSSHASRCTLFSFDTDIETEEVESAQVSRGEGAALKRSSAFPKLRNQNHTVGKKFKMQMSSLSDLLSATNCTFIRCIKPNNSMTPGLFENRFVMDQVRSLGVVQTCEVLRQGLPARIQFAEIDAIYRAHFIGVNLRLTENMTGKDFTEAVLWALRIPKSAYKLGKSRVFFNVNSLNDMNRVLNAYADLAELDVIVKRVIRFIHFKRWKRAFAVGYSFSVCLKLLEDVRLRHRSSILIQRKWKAYALSNLRARKLLARRRWKVAMYYTICCRHFLGNYKLICEAREVRLKAERTAEKMLQESRAAELKQQQLIDEMALRKGVDMEVATKSCARKFRSTLNIGQRNSSLLNQQEISENTALFKENKELEAALMEQQKDQSKSEMKKLAAASSLATVSVALFRWTKIKKFRAFEKWMIFYKSGEKMTKVAEPGDDSELIGLKSSRLDREADNIENLTLADGSYLCFECKDRGAKVWCHDCNQPYCLVCSQFVHNSCSFMRYHCPLSIDNKPSLENIQLLSTPMEPLSSFVAAGTMKAMVNAVLFSESDLQNNKSSISKMLYFSQANNELNLELTGNQASVLLDREYENHGEEEEEREYPESQQITFSGSGGLLHGEDGEVQHCAIRSCEMPASKGISIRFCTAHYDEFRSATRRMSNGDEDVVDDDTASTLQQQVALLKKQLLDSGQQPVEFVELSVARALMQEAVERLMSGEESAEADIEKWDKAIRLNPEYQAEMLEKARKWEEDERPANEACLRQMRGIVPVDVRQISSATMQEQGLPKKVAQRIWQKKILWFVCTHTEDIARIHVADLRTKYSFVGCDIIELRAVYAALPVEFENDGDGKKKEWRDAFRQKLEEFSVKEAGNRLSNPEKRNFAYKGYETLSIYDPDVPVMRAELLKSDAFGPTDVANIAELSGIGGVKDKQKQMASRNEQAALGGGGRVSDGVDRDEGGDGQEQGGGGKKEQGGGQVKSRLIAESALAADEQKRAEARGSLITVMSNPLVDKQALAALRRPKEQEQDKDQDNNKEQGAQREPSSPTVDSVLDGGMQSIQQTILKLELAKKQKTKSKEDDEKDEKEREKEEEKKHHFSDQYMRPSGGGGGKPGGGRGRGGRGRHAHGERGGAGGGGAGGGGERGGDNVSSREWLLSDEVFTDDSSKQQQEHEEVRGSNLAEPITRVPFAAAGVVQTDGHQKENTLEGDEKVEGPKDSSAPEMETGTGSGGVVQEEEEEEEEEGVAKKESSNGTAVTPPPPPTGDRTTSERTTTVTPNVEVDASSTPPSASSRSEPAVLEQPPPKEDSIAAVSSGTLTSIADNDDGLSSSSTTMSSSSSAAASASSTTTSVSVTSASTGSQLQKEEDDDGFSDKIVFKKKDKAEVSKKKGGLWGMMKKK